MVSNPVTGALIDTRVYGGRRACYREKKNRLKRDGASEVVTPPSLSLFGSEKESAVDKRKRDESRPSFGPGENALVECCVEDYVASESAADGVTFLFQLSHHREVLTPR